MLEQRLKMQEEEIRRLKEGMTPYCYCYLKVYYK